MKRSNRLLPIAIISSILAALLVPEAALAATEGAVEPKFLSNIIPSLAIESQRPTDLPPQLEEATIHVIVTDAAGATEIVIEAVDNATSANIVDDNGVTTDDTDTITLEAGDTVATNQLWLKMDTTLSDTRVCSGEILLVKELQ